jgi:hypothetical protein
MYEDRQWYLFFSCLLGLRVTPLVGPTPFIGDNEEIVNRLNT